MSTHRFEDERFLRGTGRYVADINLENQLYAKIVRSVHGHANIINVDISEALMIEGVCGVYIEEDLAKDGVGPLPCTTKFSAEQPLVLAERFALARKKVRHVGDPIALVIAETEMAAQEGAELVLVDYEALPVVVNPVHAPLDGSPVIWSTAPDNIAYRFKKGEQKKTLVAFGQAAHIVDLDIENNRVMALPIEPRAGIGEYDEQNDIMRLTCTAQGVHAIREQLAHSVFSLDEERIQISAPDVGGGFGLKNFLFPEWVLLLWASKKYKRAVKWVADRAEDHSASLHGRDIRTTAKLALDTEGRFLALQAKLTANMGAYLSAGGPNASTNSAPTAMGGIYKIPFIYMESVGVFTNTTPIDAYRGAGKPEANFIIERLIDAAASRCGFDPVELRLLNAIDEFPHETAFGMRIDSGSFRENIQKASEYIEKSSFSDRKNRAHGKGLLRGLGVGCFLETARGAPQEGASITFTSTGRIELRVGTESNGQGHETTFKQIASTRLGVPIKTLDYIQADTEQVSIGFGHGGARSMHMGAGTMALAIDSAIKKAASVAAILLQTEERELSFEKGLFSTNMDERSISIGEVALAARNPDIGTGFGENGIDTFYKREEAPFTFPNGCHAAEVEIDPDTGSISLINYVMVDDYGSLVNPVLTEGQLHGGVAQGIGQALEEFVAFDPDSGQLLSGSLMDYTAPRAAFFPFFKAHFNQIPTEANILGVKGVGQAGCIAAPQVITHAVLNALEKYNIDHIQMPITSQSLWRSIRAAQ
ncbi:MAG: xanthine dehydrogenase family protein molybdopterin-binding subunit [Rhodospirillaceae bacterium]|nr:xanthine dehydrogenase family protein molybdopterin-binding subunit [Rhodospirillaceae bacterium]